MNEVMVCKFDDKIQCFNYACEEDISTLEVTKMECALHARMVEAKQALDDYCEGCSRFTEKTFECTLKKADSCPVLKVRLCFSQEKKSSVANEGTKP